MLGIGRKKSMCWNSYAAKQMQLAKKLYNIKLSRLYQHYCKFIIVLNILVMAIKGIVIVTYILEMFHYRQMFVCR